ncbi:hypothetical protein [Paenibacillus sp. JJ1683]
MTDNKLNENTPIVFLKFSNNVDWLNDIKNGNLYMNNGRYFIEREKATGEKGIGDKFELSNIIKNAEIRDANTEVLFGTGDINFRFDFLGNKPLFCLSLLQLKHFKLIETNDVESIYSLNLSRESLEQMRGEFGEYALIINYRDFSDRISESFQKQNYKFFHGSVIYHDENSLAERFQAHIKFDPKLFFYKHNTFSHQLEYRFVLDNVQSEQPLKVNIGDLSDIAQRILTIEELSTCKFRSPHR